MPAEISDNNPVSAEAWFITTAVSQQNSTAIGYGIQGGSSSPEEDREFNYNTNGSGGVSGDFGTYDTPWGTRPAAGAWHYLAWTYNGSSINLYLDGVLNASGTPATPLQTPATAMGVGAWAMNISSNLVVDALQGYIAARPGRERRVNTGGHCDQLRPRLAGDSPRQSLRPAWPRRRATARCS